MRLYKYLKKNKITMARIYVGGKQVACFTCGKLHPDIPDLGERIVLRAKQDDDFMDITVDANAQLILGGV